MKETAPQRILMWSALPFEIDSRGAVRFIRNTRIREVAVYNNAIEYDMRFQTNNLGFVDNHNYDAGDNQGPATRKYAFVGDSFGVGEGGYPWVPELRDKLILAKKNIAIYNLSITGVGLEAFLKILKSASYDLAFTDIVILAITGDIGRRIWWPLIQNGEIYFCLEHETEEACLRRNNTPLAVTIDYNASRDEILNYAKALGLRLKYEYYYNRALNRHKTFWNQIKAFSRKSVFLSSLNALRKQVRLTRRIDLTPLGKIRSLFPQARVYFVHLPDKDEVRSGRYKLEFGKQAEAMGIYYIPALSKCYWPRDMFHKRDGHPNASGYKNISECLKRCLF